MDAHHRIRDIFEAAVDLPRDRRSAFLRERCSADHTVYAEVARLLQAYEGGVEAVDGEGADVLDSIGPLIAYGAYEIGRELGRGGMGAVYLARRVDGTFERQVAVKVIRADKVAGTALERFARERRLLARINHPGIATLFDAGTTESGMPYFVMEYVDGVTLTEYCDRQRLDVRARIVLFMRVCEAVAAAHRVPIVHCDLKPTNILVDAEGRPRVLDFGIATALTRGGQEEEPALDPYGSPRYASPEQMRGDAVQTTSDIYSLGVVLHELLVGRAPVAPATREGAAGTVVPSALLEAGDDTAARLDRPTQIAALRGTTVAALHTTISGDLDAIVGRCLQAVPELRYPTVDALHQDLQRWLERRPVTARSRTFAYVTSRFVGRHRWLVSAAAAVLLLMAASVAAVIYEWRAAEAARSQAERRFTDVRQLATSLFDVDAALADVAGATEIRRTIVENASRYLDRLAQDSADDSSLSLELAESYRRVGDMLGNPNVPNLGQRDEALQKYGLASSQIAKAAALRTNDPTIRLAEARIEASKGDVLLAQRRLDQARAAYEQGASIVQALLQRDSNNDTLGRTLAGIYRPLGEVHLAAAHPTEALQVFEKARALDLAAVARSPESADAQRLLALSQLRVAEALAAAGRSADAIDTYREAARLLGALSSRAPTKARLVRDVAIGRMKLGTLVDDEAAGRGLSELEQALAMFRELARLDVRNAGAQRDLLVALVALGDAVVKTDTMRARASYLEAQRLAEMLHAEPFNDPQADRDLRIVRERLAGAALGQPADPELRLAIVRDGTDVPLDKHARPPAVGDDVRLSWRPLQGQSQYVLVLGGEGRASLLSRDEIAAAGWRLKTNGPPPSQTLLLITSSRALVTSERDALIDRISRVPGPRRVPPDAHILWRTHRPEVLDSSATARGGADLEWPALVRAELERVPELRFSGRTFPLGPR